MIVGYTPIDWSLWFYLDHSPHLSSFRRNLLLFSSAAGFRKGVSMVAWFSVHCSAHVVYETNGFSFEP